MSSKTLWLYNFIKLEEEIKDYYDIENQKISSKINELDSIRNKKINEAENVFKESIKLIDKKYEHIFETMSNEKIEKDKEALKHIKEKLPDCYICNLDGKVVV